MKAKKLISWKVLDRYKTSRGIAALLRKRKIKGLKGSFSLCPLALATGWKVTEKYRIPYGIPLTYAEKNFVAEYDSGKYPDLELK